MSAILTLKLRVYPSEAQQRLIHTYFRARQFAYHFGVAQNVQAWRDWKEMADAFPMYRRDIPKPKWKNQNQLSKELTVLKKEVELYNETSETPHPDSFILTVPRCIFSQALDDYQKCLNKAFKDRMGKKLSKGKMAGFPHFYAFYKRKTFRYQIDKPSTNQKHISTWREGKIRLGELVLRYKDPTKLPEKLPSLVTVTQNAYGQYFAMFASSEPRTYADPVKEEKRILRILKLEDLKQLAKKELRQLAYDPNMQAEYYFDSTGQSFSLSENVDKKKLMLKLVKHAKYLSKTQQRNKKQNIKPSKRSLKAQRTITKDYNDRKNQRTDFNHKLTTTLAVCYSQQAREPLDVKEMMEKSGKTQSRARNDRTYRRYHISRSFADLALSVRRALMDNKLIKYHGDDSILITLDKYERTTQCCCNPDCREERVVVRLGSKAWQCPYCLTIHIRDECAAQNVLDKGFNLSSRKANKPKPLLIKDFSLAFPDLEIDPKKGFPVARTVGLDVGKRRRFVRFERMEKDSLGMLDTRLFERLSSIGVLRVAQNRS